MYGLARNGVPETELLSQLQIIRETDQSVLPVQALLRCLNKKPGLKDTNFQVLKARIEAVKMLADLGEMSR